MFSVFYSLSSSLCQDWPSEKHFRTEFTELYDAFMAAVPFPDTMTLNGARNLAAHFPTNGIAPDGGKDD